MMRQLAEDLAKEASTISQPTLHRHSFPTNTSTSGFLAPLRSDASAWSPSPCGSGSRAGPRRHGLVKGFFAHGADSRSERLLLRLLQFHVCNKQKNGKSMTRVGKNYSSLRIRKQTSTPRKDTAKYTTRGDEEDEGICRTSAFNGSARYQLADT